MNEAVLDSSAVLAVLQSEPGANLVLATLPGALLSTVNFAEVVTKLTMSGMPAFEARLSVEGLGVDIIEFTLEQAELTGGLRPITARPAFPWAIALASPWRKPTAQPP